jgi:hypothetical protein
MCAGLITGSIRYVAWVLSQLHTYDNMSRDRGGYLRVVPHLPMLSTNAICPDETSGRKIESRKRSETIKSAARMSCSHHFMRYCILERDSQFGHQAAGLCGPHWDAAANQGVGFDFPTSRSRRHPGHSSFTRPKLLGNRFGRPSRHHLAGAASFPVPLQTQSSPLSLQWGAVSGHSAFI